MRSYPCADFARPQRCCCWVWRPLLWTACVWCRIAWGSKNCLFRFGPLSWIILINKVNHIIYTIQKMELVISSNVLMDFLSSFELRLTWYAVSRCPFPLSKRDSLRLLQHVNIFDCKRNASTPTMLRIKLKTLVVSGHSFRPSGNLHPVKEHYSKCERVMFDSINSISMCDFIILRPYDGRAKSPLLGLSVLLQEWPVRSNTLIGREFIQLWAVFLLSEMWGLKHDLRDEQVGNIFWLHRRSRVFQEGWAYCDVFLGNNSRKVNLAW